MVWEIHPAEEPSTPQNLGLIWHLTGETFPDLCQLMPLINSCATSSALLPLEGVLRPSISARSWVNPTYYFLKDLVIWNRICCCFQNRFAGGWEVIMAKLSLLRASLRAFAGRERNCSKESKIIQKRDMTKGKELGIGLGPQSTNNLGLTTLEKATESWGHTTP